MHVNIANSWTAERSTLLEQLIGQSMTAAEIGAELGVTRNAVIGKAHRLGLSITGGPVKAAAAAALRPDNPKPRKSRARAALNPEPVEPAPPRETITRPEPHGMRLLPLEDLGTRNCKWVEGDPRESFFYCGNDVKQGSSYCPGHHAVCYMPRASRGGSIPRNFRLPTLSRMTGRTAFGSSRILEAE